VTEPGRALRSRFRGSLLGLAVGDGLGARFEGQSAEFIRRRFPTPGALLGGWSAADAVDTAGMAPGIARAAEALRPPPFELLRYTDDTQMAIGVAETLTARDRPTVDDYAQAFVRNYQPWRGYGRGARFVLERIEDGVDPREAAVAYFPTGSYGNGAAMRVAPVGLRFRGDVEALLAQARASALPTHAHALGVEGAVLLARAVGLLVAAERFDRDAFFDALLETASEAAFASKLERARGIGGEDVGALGNGIEALESVPTALACFACWPDSFADAVGSAILLGGDTDTIAAMTGALSGAFLGESAIPHPWLDALEDEPEVKGRTDLGELAEKLETLAVT